MGGEKSIVIEKRGIMLQSEVVKNFQEECGLRRRSRINIAPAGSPTSRARRGAQERAVDSGGHIPGPQVEEEIKNSGNM